MELWDGKFDLLRIADPDVFCFMFMFICKEPQCGYQYKVKIKTEGEFGVCKATVGSHIVSHLRPL